MVLNYENYKKALENESLTDEQGRTLMRNAMRRAAKRKKNLRWVAAVAACVGIVTAVGSGAVFAATGKSPLQIFANLYENSAQETQEISEGFVETNETFAAGNLELTLEQYWYDQKNEFLFLKTKCNTTDGSALLDDDTISEYLEDYGYENAADADEETIQEMYQFCLAYQKASFEPDASAAGMRRIEIVDETTVYYYEMWAGFDEEGEAQEDWTLIANIDGQDIGVYALEDCGEMAEREADASVLADCTEIKIIGAGILLTFESNGEDAYASWADDLQMDITMFDGTVYRVEQSGDVESESEGYELTEEEEQRVSDGTFHLCETCWSSGLYPGEMADDFVTKAKMIAVFPDYIDVNDIISFTVNGEECMLQ